MGIRTRNHRAALACALGVTLLIGLVGAAAPAGAQSAGRAAAKAPTITYVGRVASLDASLAVVTDGKHAFAYLCDSAQLSEWFRGDASKRTLNLDSASGAQLAVGLTGKRAEGLVLLADGTTADVTLKAATGKAGLFRAEQVIDGTGYAAGWVVLPDGDLDGQVSLANVDGARTLPLPEVAPTTDATAVPTEVVGTVAPKTITATFPTTPPADSEVTVVPFNATANTDATDAGGGGQPAGSGDPSGGGTTTQPPVATGNNCQGQIDFTRGQISALRGVLDETSRLRRGYRTALTAQIDGLQGLLDSLIGHPNSCGTLPLH